MSWDIVFLCDITVPNSSYKYSLCLAKDFAEYTNLSLWGIHHSLQLSEAWFSDRAHACPLAELWFRIPPECGGAVDIVWASQKILLKKGLIAGKQDYQ